MGREAAVAPLRLVTLVRTCPAFPSQWEGSFEDGARFYARWRQGWFYAGWGAHWDAAVAPDEYDDAEGRFLVNRSDLPDDDPEMSTERMLELCEGKVVRGWTTP